jgi:hypothetical protein
MGYRLSEKGHAQAAKYNAGRLAREVIALWRFANSLCITRPFKPSD